MNHDIAILGAGAAGLFCAALLAQAGFNVSVFDNGKRAGRKILMSGGGRCNFTNLDVDASHYISTNPHFCKSALSRFSPWNFIDYVQRAQIAYEERESGQLFCQNSAQDIVNLLLNECQKGNVQFYFNHELETITKNAALFELHFAQKKAITTQKVIVATGGLSMPRLGTTPIGYKIAESLAIPIVPVRAGLVPFTLHHSLLEALSPLAGIATPAVVSLENGRAFKGNVLFTHRGLSGPAILQISSYWHAGDAIYMNLFPDDDFPNWLDNACQHSPQQKLKTCLSHILPKRLVDALFTLHSLPDCLLKQLTPSQKNTLNTQLTKWAIIPNGTEGYRTAEVTLGGVDTHFINSKTMAAQAEPNLYFIGEVLDVTGWLGGYNFQWCWSSAFACAQGIIHAK